MAFPNHAYSSNTCSTRTRKKVLLSWSGGKDSALTLYELRNNCNYRICALLTTITEEYDRISMHGVRRILLENQAESLGIPLEKVFISRDMSDKDYELKMKTTLEKYSNEAVFIVGLGMYSWKMYENIEKITSPK